ncbi:MAG TPA: carboxypeptidase-like regulatory domain-containing protein, partial [Candidatus Acidoferrum sp.]|nr:carboxypeptidase-like regulatory domain-containing protein [Candidatus Acidoferrum sp.]
MTTDQNGLLPIADAQVIVHSANDGSDRTVVSDGEGRFAVAGLTPGPYRLTARKEGFTGTLSSTVEVAEGGNPNVNLPLRNSDSGSPPQQQANQPGFFSRFFKAYGDDWKGT